MEPLTVQMTDEQIKRKQEQQKAKAPPPGASRILTRANREQKKHQQEVKNASPVRNPATKPAEASKTIVDPSTGPGKQLTSEVASKTAANKQADDAEEWQNYVEDLNPGLFPIQLRSRPIKFALLLSLNHFRHQLRPGGKDAEGRKLSWSSQAETGQLQGQHARGKAGRCLHVPRDLQNHLQLAGLSIQRRRRRGRRRCGQYSARRGQPQK